MTDSEILEGIFEGEKMIYILHGDTTRINQLIKDYNRDYENVADYPFNVSDPDPERILDLTLRQLLCKTFVVNTDMLDDLNGSMIKEFVHGENHEQALQLLGYREPYCNRKLIIVTTSDPHGSMFHRDSGLRARSESKFIGIDWKQ